MTQAVRYKWFITAALSYILLYVIIDHNTLNSSMRVAIDQYNNILLIYFYSIIGIWSLMCLSNIIQYWKPLNYIGKHSILFYFLNGSILTIISALMHKVPFMDSNNYINQIIVAIIATVFTFPCVWFINKYMPILRGAKDSFNRISHKIGLKISW